jgi:DNA invertase Pin-like site-specific DNA recombinase
MIIGTDTIAKARKIFVGFEQAVDHFYGSDPGTLLSASVYLRKSIQRDDRDAEGIGTQLYHCCNQCIRQGWYIAEIYLDEGISASKGLYRPDYVRLNEDVESRRIWTKRIVARDQSRITRDDLELLLFLRAIDKHGIKVIDSRGRQLRNDANTKIKGMHDQDYSKAIGESIQQKRELNAAAGLLPKLRDRPYGYTAGYEQLVESEAEVLREAAQRYLSGHSLHMIVNDFRQRGITKYTGKPWIVSHLSRALARPENAGIRRYINLKTRNVQLFYNTLSIPKLWSEQFLIEHVNGLKPEEFYDLIVKRISQNKPFSHSTTRKHLLVGILVCGECQHPLSAKNNTQYPNYACVSSRGGCGKVARNMPILDSYFLQLTYEGMKRLEAVEVTEVVDDAITPKINFLQDKIAESRDAYKADAISLADFIDIKSDAELKIKELQKQRQPIRNPMPVESAEAFRSSKDNDLKRATILRMWGRVAVMPSGRGVRFHPDQLKFN